MIVAPVVTRSVEQTSDDDENPHQEINDVENVVESDGTFDAVSEYSSHNEGNQTAKKVWIMLSWKRKSVNDVGNTGKSSVGYEASILI